jgi:hypothetical protein
MNSCSESERPIAMNRLLMLGILVAKAICLQGCVPMYCAINHGNIHDTEELKMFEWETELRGVDRPHSNDLAIMESSQQNRWIVFNRSYHDTYRTKQHVVDESGNHIETLPYRDMRRNSPHRKFRTYETYTLFTSEPRAYTRANVSVSIEKFEYPGFLEVESLLRFTFGRIVAPFMGKSGRAFINNTHDYFRCCPPQLVVTTTQPDSSTTTRRFTFPDYDIDKYNPNGTMISIDGRFLYIYFNDQAALIGLE